jgi:short-subunit dehydrogenase
MRVRKLEGGRALITGASAGIGEAFARHFAEQGFDLVLAARSADKLEKIAAELRARHAVDVRLHPCDLLDPATPAKLLEACSDLEIDVLVNNAGLMYHGDFCDQDESSVDAVIQLNIAALSRLTRLFLVPMLARKRGRILNLTSTGRLRHGAGPRPHQHPYDGRLLRGRPAERGFHHDVDGPHRLCRGGGFPGLHGGGGHLYSRAGQ